MSVGVLRVQYAVYMLDTCCDMHNILQNIRRTNVVRLGGKGISYKGSVRFETFPWSEENVWDVHTSKRCASNVQFNEQLRVCD